ASGCPTRPAPQSGSVVSRSSSPASFCSRAAQLRRHLKSPRNRMSSRLAPSEVAEVAAAKSNPNRIFADHRLESRRGRLGPQAIPEERLDRDSTLIPQLLELAGRGYRLGRPALPPYAPTAGRILRPQAHTRS